MKTDSLIINLHHIPEDGLELCGELPSTLLEIDDHDPQRRMAPLTYELRLSLVDHGQGILVEGNVNSTLYDRCDRCLEQTSQSITNPAVCHYLESVTETLIDITDKLREDLLIEYPTRVLCRPDCAGLCPSCGKNQNTDHCDCAPSTSSPPSIWDPLAELS